MTNGRAFPFTELYSADLLIDAIYQGGRKGNAGDDPFPSLLTVSNQGGFRYRGNLTKLEMVVLTSSLSDPDWPDAVDRETGVFTYYGDNKRPGRALHVRLETVMNSLDAFLRVPTQESKVGAKFLRYLSFPTLGNGAT